MDLSLLLTAAVVGIFVSLGLASLTLAATERLGGGAIVLIAVVAIGVSYWRFGTWQLVGKSPTMDLLPNFGSIAAGALVGAVIGAILPLILNAIGESMRGDVY